MSEARIAFRLAGSGWADLVIQAGDTRHEISGISYLSNALDDLLRVGIALATHRHVATAEFFHEPGSTILLAETAWWSDGEWHRGTRLSAVEGRDYGEHEEAVDVLLAKPRSFCLTFSSPDALARAILDTAEGVERDYGRDGYARLWNGAHGFPARGVAALRAALAAPRSEELNYGG